MEKKTQQLQLRVSPREKAAIRRAAKRAGLDISSWVLGRLFPDKAVQFEELIEQLKRLNQASLALAELNDFLSELSRAEFHQVTSVMDLNGMNAFLRNYVAAMVEEAAHQKQVTAPTWVTQIEPLEEPYFGAALESLRVHLLMNAPIPFRKRNIFIDASIGDRV